MANNDLWRIYRKRLKLELNELFRKLRMCNNRFCVDNNKEGDDDDDVSLPDPKNSDEENSENSEEMDEMEERKFINNHLKNSAFNIVNDDDDHVINPMKKDPKFE